ncbi:hypothetical protein MACJ_001664 [Theileria orientalis]|uniref:Uncharacterized protein n=1 Tax=Theileria orientalis TaxID=68886 RepID=A0A976M8Y8_THEOR|nr:hypothetical protein MACJ_001664 [Theileria orientalis]
MSVYDINSRIHPSVWDLNRLNKYQPFATPTNDLTLDPKSEYHSKNHIDSEDTSPIVSVSSNEFVLDKRLRLQVNDLTHFFITKFQNLTTYKLVNLRMYCEVKHKGNVLWIDKRHRSKAVFPDLIHIYTDDDIICLDFTGTKFLMHNRRRFHMFTQFVKEVYRAPSIKAEEENTTSFHLKLKFDGSSGSANTTVLEIKPKSPGVSKKFNNGEKCVEITSENITIWKRDPLRDGGNYPTEVYSDYFIKKIVKIKFAGRAHSYSYAHDQWCLKTLSIDDSSSHRMDTEPIDGLYGDTTEASSEEYSGAQSTIGESTDPSTTEQSTDLTTDDEEFSEITEANEESTDVTAASEEPSATESSTSTETGEPTSNETAEPVPTHSTDSALATESTNADSTDTSSDTLTGNAATSENGNDGQVIESSVYL